MLTDMGAGTLAHRLVGHMLARHGHLRLWAGQTSGLLSSKVVD